MGSRFESGLLRALFGFCVYRPWWVIGFCMLCMLAAGSFIPKMEKDLRSDAFLADDNPAVVYRNIVKEQFGLSDPLVVAIMDDGPAGVYRPEVLALLQWLTSEVSELDNIDANRVVSLATENNIISSKEGMEVRPFLEGPVDSPDAIANLRAELEQFPLYVDSLVSEDGKVALVIAELVDEDRAESTYHSLMALLQRAPLVEGVTTHVAGEGAVMGYLVSYVDADAQRLIPFAGLVIFLVIFLAFRQPSPAFMCAFIMLATLSGTIGIMAANGVPFYVITNALPVILVGISVADSIHVYSHYFELQQGQPEAGRRELLVVETMLAMWRPITLTTLTTMAGFLGLYYASYMPPFINFGLYAALGVGLAWLYTMTFLPAAMALTRPGVRGTGASMFSSFMTALGNITLRYSRWIIAAFIVFTLLGGYAAGQLRVDDDPIGLFLPDEPLAIADQVLNRHTRGSNTLDIVVETAETEGLFDPNRLRKIEAMQAFVGTLPFVGGSASIVDYLKQMNRALNEGLPEAYRLPDSAELVAQYFLIYSAMSDPTDFEEEIDYDYRLANIRVNTLAGGYQEARQIVEPLQRYIDQEFNEEGMSATLSGRVNLNYRWIKELSVSHFDGLFIVLVLVWGVSALLFRSEMAGLYTMVPVGGTVLGVYAVMVALDISLGMGTSMFAAISIGLGIDFAIHTLDRLRTLCQAHAGNIEAAMREFYPTTGRALLFNFLSIAFGFGVLVLSKITSLSSFGSIVMLSIGISFLASMTVLPAMVLRLRPGFIMAPPKSGSAIVTGRVFSLAVLAVLLTVLLVSPSASAQETLQADAIVEKVNAVDDGEYVTRTLAMTLTDRRGKERHRETITYRKYYGDEIRTVVFYLSPANVRDTAFLIWDYPEITEEDDQWLYLPAMRKVRRISAADRGDYFLGTDFTYEDIKLDGKLEPNDYEFSLLGEQVGSDAHYFQLAGVPRTEAIASELGYSRMETLIDTFNYMIVEAKFWDLKGNELKTLEVSDIVEIDGIWTRGKLTINNHQTGHQTLFQFTDVDYLTPVEDSFFSKQALERGHR